VRPVLATFSALLQRAGLTTDRDNAMKTLLFVLTLFTASLCAEERYVDRDHEGKINGVYVQKQKPGQELKSLQDPEVQAFLNPVTIKNGIKSDDADWLKWAVTALAGGAAGAVAASASKRTDVPGKDPSAKNV